jgi:hypothetical protein
MSEAIPPAICWIDELTPMKAPRSCGLGNCGHKCRCGDHPACDTNKKKHIQTDDDPERSNAEIAINEGHHMQVIAEPARNTLYFPILSLSFPINGLNTSMQIPVIIYNVGSSASAIPRLLTPYAVPKGISINPPVASNVVAANA